MSNDTPAKQIDYRVSEKGKFNVMVKIGERYL